MIIVENSVSNLINAANNVISTISGSAATGSEIIEKATEELKGAMALDKGLTMLESLYHNSKIFCAPPQFNHITDPRYYKNIDIGRVYAKTYMAAPTIFSIAPCGVKFDPLGGITDGQSTFVQQCIQMAKGDSSLAAAINEDLDKGVDKIYTTEYRYNEYMNVVNFCMRLIAIYMGIGDKLYPGSSMKYKEFDWSLKEKASDRLSKQMYRKPGTMYAYYDSTNGVKNEGITKVFDNIFSDVKAYKEDQPINWLHFYINGEGTDISESFTTSLSQSAIATSFNETIGGLAKELNFLTGANFHGDLDADMEADFDSLYQEALGKSSFLAQLFKVGKGYLGGAKLIFPSIIDDVTYGKTMSVTTRCISPYGDRESIYLYCIAPMIHLLPFAVPQQYDRNMYTFPFIAKVSCKGKFSSDIAVITNFRIKKGGPDDRSWSAEGLPTEIEISFDVTPMYSTLMLPNIANPLFASFNSSLHEYLAVTTGVDLTRKNFDLTRETMKLIYNTKSFKEAFQKSFERFLGNGIGGFTSDWIEAGEKFQGAVSGAFSITGWDPFGDPK